jgi:hypothetical protein
MKRLLKFFGTTGFLALLMTMPAVAQIVNGLTFATTFPFYAGNTKLPAGSYKVTPTTYDPTVLQIESTTGSHSAFIDCIPTQSENAHKTGDVTFKKYGQMDFLDRIWVAGQTYGLLVAPTNVEKKAAASAESQPHSVPAK